MTDRPPIAWFARRLRELLVHSFLLLGPGLVSIAQAQEKVPDGPPPTNSPIQVVAIQGTNWWIAPAGADDWVLASTRMPQNLKPGDRIRTGRHTRLFLRTRHLGVIQVPPLSTIEISPPPGEEKSAWLRILQGMIYFFHRGSPTDVEVHTKSASAAIRGTEFVAEAQPDGGLVIRLVEGAVELRNAQGTVVLRGGDQGVAATGQVPSRTPLLYAVNAIQWCLYYPAVIDPDEIPLSAEARALLEGPLRAYREGDLVQALANYPAEREPQSVPEGIYLAALWQGIGQVDQADALLEHWTGAQPPAGVVRRLAEALRLMKDATQQKPRPPALEPELASEWLSESYYLQSLGKLAEAREAARHAVGRSPAFGFAWVRLGELEFSFGRIAQAIGALTNALRLAPRHAPALALEGFLFSAQAKIPAATAAFDRALALDPGLGNAWLGRGLCRIRQGQVAAGLEDLETAAAVEPQRALFRSYLGKAFDTAGDSGRAFNELRLARDMDPSDPTAWLYAALSAHEHNRINEGIRDLEGSKKLNQQRQLYRSRHLLDQDQAVRGANLAAVYRDAGMEDLSRREAVDAINTDYANYSAHLFLANNYNELRDPRQVDLRYETPWFNEYLVANLLAPVGAGTLSPLVSEQEFSRLFERNRFGVVSYTEYGSRGDWTQSGAQYGTFDTLAYAVESDYRVHPGQRRNNDLEQMTLSVKLKQQFGLDDSVYLQAIYYDANGGDLAQVYDPKNPALFRSRYRFQENQEPLLWLGYHHQWSPEHHTLALAGRLHDRVQVSDPAQPVLLVSKDPNDAVTGTLLTSVQQSYRSELEIYGAEVQHIAEIHPWTLIGGARYQLGEFDTANRERNLADQSAALPVPLQQGIRPDLHRLTAYAYSQWQVFDPLRVVAGLSYDYLEYPSNFRFAPMHDGEQHRDQWSPKVGLIWNPTPASTVRAAYAQSLGGVSLEQSDRLEPSQVAGFNQAWRSLMPESVVGAQAGASFAAGSLEWEYRLRTGTYLAVRGDLRNSDLDRKVGVFDLRFLAEPSFTREHLDYQERILTVTLNQRVGQDWALGADYLLNNAELKDRFPLIPGSVPHLFPPYQLKPRQDLESTLHQFRMFALFNHPSGLFARAESLWSAQSNQGYAPGRPGDDFWQFNLFAGYRWPRRRAEVRLGLLNLADQDYRLNPLNLTAELPRKRTVTASLKLNF